MSGDGPSMHFEESATFRVIHNATGAEEVQSSCEATDSSDDSHESTQYLDVPRPSRKDSSPVFFDASTDDGSIYSFYDYEADAGNTGDVQDSVTADVFSDDEFGPINMSFSKRPPTPLTRPRPLRIEVHANKSLPPSPTSFTSHMQRSSLGASSACDSESMSRSTLYSLDSCATSVTCVTQNQDTKFIGRSYYDSEKSDERKFNDADAPKSATEPQKMVDLQSVGYDFSWSRFIPRSEAALYMRPEDQVDMEVHVPRVSLDYAPHWLFPYHSSGTELFPHPRTIPAQGPTQAEQP